MQSLTAVNDLRLTETTKYGYTEKENRCLSARAVSNHRLWIRCVQIRVTYDDVACDDGLTSRGPYTAANTFVLPMWNLADLKPVKPTA